ncbi:MAG TPA: XrtA system polysaccharide deacetylase [Gemmatimonadales bacterium]|nr:XrtA system polysaccharide deacetylase [Gemmatimonadales bacterium]
MLRHHFTVDVEEYFQVSAFEAHVPRADWEHLPRRLSQSVRRLLELLGTAEVRGTFFVLGWIARRQPDVVREIARAGHEIASHGWDHRRVTEQTPAEFRDSVRRSRRELEDLTGDHVVGFRAPSFSIVPGCEWALDVLAEEGYRYDSSLFPVKRPGGKYGYPGGGRDPHWLVRTSGPLAELPPATLDFWGMRLPAGGGAYFRLFPYGLVQAALRDCQHRGVPGTFYIHPWELDAAQPRFPVPWSTRIRHYGGLGRTDARLDRLLREFRFTTMASTVATL